MRRPFPLRRKRTAILRDERGLSAVEFALISPVFLSLLLGGADMAHSLYMNSVLEGILQKAGRDASLETGTETARQAQIDALVTARVKELARAANVTVTRRYFKDFTKAAQAVGETFFDGNANGVCDAGEAYQDTNNNNVRDADGGDSGQGGAKDTVIYTADISYPRLFPMYKMVGLPATVNMRATTVLANQPYGEQAQYGAPTTRNCT
ncbi:TadE/TadG family type IV pilus assembly protein [Sphingobium algorifonticola]|uniref:Pilus assembly protein n=1 Tax=Sphingobium algorifonticola TaxID=2008318 RepID=A0A437JB75_9SPHN|nr:TadE/TadG family type IV pilus assembly protein [Sphingobium algorifonticola]RVT43121.1 pilus assembly protein [Sphingobium algorifonticola]